MESIQRIVYDIGQPTQLQSDPRAGLGAAWGSRETGELMSSKDLSKWFQANVATIQRVLRGE